MNDTELIHKIELLKEVKPSHALHRRMKTVIDTLPVQQKKGFSLTSMLRICVVALFLILISTSGIVVASNHVSPGNVLYPVKKAFIKAQIIVATNPVKKATLEEQLKEPKIIPSPTPTPTRSNEENKRNQKKGVHGVSDFIQQGWFQNHGEDNSHHHKEDSE